MTCKMVQKYLPLLAGGDLAARKERKLLAHLDRCPRCREELEGYRNAIGRVKASARQESAGDWSGAEWKALIARATAQGTEKAGSPAGLRPRWALASGIAAVILLAALAFLFRDAIFGSRGSGAERQAAVVKKEEPKAAPAKPVPPKPAGKKGKSVPVVQPEYLAKNAAQERQDVLSVTMVSQETGLQVVWFFNKNFEWKGDQK
jgi:anti-sigma factor RsiW